jgi:hypothetical protein
MPLQSGQIGAGSEKAMAASAAVPLMVGRASGDFLS